jgi:hypothetical protein
MTAYFYSTSTTKYYYNDVQSLEEEFQEEEVLAILQDIAGDKAPGPDGFIGVFLKRSWPVIKGDLIEAFNFFYLRHDQHFKQLNTAHLVLIPKKSDARRVGDYRPISLTHCIAKLISKCLANRLAEFLN